MYIRSLQISNFMRLEGVNIDAQGKHVIISGQNGIGKTSVVEAIWEALQGSSAKDRPEPVHQGAAKALIRLDLGDFLVEKHISADGKSRLIVKAADGTKVSSPQKLLDGLLSAYALDPVAFLDRRPQDQLDDVLKVCGVEPPVAQVEAITGEKCPPRIGESADSYMERLSADEVGEWYRRRREQHRVVETNRGAVEKQQALCQTLGVGDPDHPTRLAEVILADLETATAGQARWDQARATVTDLEREKDRLGQLFDQVCKERDTLDRQIAELEAKLATARGQRETVQTRITNGEKVLADNGAELVEAQARLGGLQDQTQAMASLRKELADVQGHQKAIIQREQADKRLEELQAEHLASQNEHGRLDRVLEDLRALRKTLLEGVDLGVDGLEVGSGELRLHGVSFKQASEAQRLRVACAVAMKDKSQLKLLRIDNGERLDSESRAFLLDLANRNGWQVIMTCVADQAELGVEIVDQEAVVEPARVATKKAAPKGKLFDDRRTAVEAGH